MKRLIAFILSAFIAIALGFLVPKPWKGVYSVVLIIGLLTLIFCFSMGSLSRRIRRTALCAVSGILVGAAYYFLPDKMPSYYVVVVYCIVSYIADSLDQRSNKPSGYSN